MAEFDFVKSFYNAAFEGDHFLREVDALLGSGQATVAALPFISEDPPKKIFEGYRSDPNSRVIRKTRLLQEGNGLTLFELQYAFRTAGQQVTQVGRFFVRAIGHYSNVYVAVSVEPAVFFHRGLLPLMRSLSPGIVVGFVPHKRLRRMLIDYKRNFGFSNLIVTRVAQRVWFQDDPAGRKSIPSVTWPKWPIEKTFKWLSDNNGWMEAIDFQAVRRGITSANTSVTREGLVRTDQLATQVFEGFVNPICKIHTENYALFSNRGRLANERRARPLVIRYGSPLFKNRSKSAALLNSLTRLPTASVSVLHGNPYLHASVLDYYDGSTCDIWVLTDNEIYLVPQLYSSVSSIKRLVNHIFDSFAEGSVSDIGHQRSAGVEE
jgi:hypothetical protein